MKIMLVSQTTIDGKLSVGESESSRYLIEQLPKEFLEEIHAYRASNDAILVGANTVRLDDPSLTNRFSVGPNPKRIIISGSLNFTFNETIFNDENETIIITNNSYDNSGKINKIREKGKKCICFDKKEFNIKNIIKVLEEQENIKTLMVEGGGEVNWLFNESNMFDEVIVYMIPVVIGGKNTVTLVDGDTNILNKFKLMDVVEKGNCVRLHYGRKG